VEVHTLAEGIRIFEDGVLIATHPVLDGRHQRRVAPGHRIGGVGSRRRMADGGVILGRVGDTVARRSLEFYDAVARQLAQESRA
jgi:hypothetical protein